MNIVINKFSTNNSNSIVSSLDKVVQSKQNRHEAVAETLSANKRNGSKSMSDTTITLGENRIIRCPEAITAMTFGPKHALKTYYRQVIRLVANLS